MHPGGHAPARHGQQVLHLGLDHHGPESGRGQKLRLGHPAHAVVSPVFLRRPPQPLIWLDDAHHLEVRRLLHHGHLAGGMGVHRPDLADPKARFS